MSSTRHHADVLVLGATLAGALAATLLARRGWKVVWAGAPPPSSVPLGEHRVRTAPGLFPSLAEAPAMARVFDEVGLLADLQRLLEPARLQLLDDRLRATVPESAAPGAPLWPELPAASEGLRSLSSEPVGTGFFARRAALRRAARLQQPQPPEGPARELVETLDALLGGGGPSHRVGTRLAAAPHVLPGGAATLIELLHRRFAELGGRVLPHVLAAPLESLTKAWSGASCTFAAGGGAGARVLVVALEDQALQRLWPATPAAEKLRLRLGASDPATLHRLSFVIRREGLPVPLGPLAVVRAASPLLLERRRLSGEVDELVAWTRPPSPEGETERVVARLARVLPFFQRHVLNRSAEQASDDTVRGPPRPLEPARRVLQAMGSDAIVRGVEGAALRGEQVATRAARLAPRQELLR